MVANKRSTTTTHFLCVFHEIWLLFVRSIAMKARIKSNTIKTQRNNHVLNSTMLCRVTRINHDRIYTTLALIPVRYGRMVLYVLEVIWQRWKEPPSGMNKVSADKWQASNCLPFLCRAFWRVMADDMTIHTKAFLLLTLNLVAFASTHTHTHHIVCRLHGHHIILNQIHRTNIKHFGFS